MKKTVLIFLGLIFSSSFFTQTFTVGEQVMAYETDDMLWYKATILESGKLECKIHWEGFSSEYDEMMSTDNMWKEGQEFLVSDKLQGLETDGKWYNAKVIKRDLPNNKYFIHWGGFDEKYDRWISYDSLRLPTKENFIEAGNFNTSTSSSSSYSSGSSSSSMSSSFSFNLRNESSVVIKYESDSGGGARSVSTLSPGNSCSVRGIVGGKLVINGSLYRTLSISDKDTKIIYK